jgi:methylmalonyl-CoA epimerase
MTNANRSGKGSVDHIAIAVSDLEGAVQQFSTLLGSPPDWRGESREQGVLVAIFNLGGTKLELLEGAGPDSTVSRFVEKKGEGLHHICLAVDDLKDTLDRLGQSGFEIIGSGEEIGAEGHPIAFVHPRSSRGVLIEFIESGDKKEE